MSNHINREFRKIKSLQFLYEVNDDGTILRNVKSKKHIKIILDYHHSKNGYYVAFVNLKGKVHRVPMHRIVAECWLGDRPEGYEIDHIDRNTHNNKYTNLRYVTHSVQMKNRVLTEKMINVISTNWSNARKIRMKPIILIKENFKQKFESMSECARFLSNEYNKSFEHMRGKLKSHRKHIYEYDVIYLNAETKHNDPQR